MHAFEKKKSQSGNLQLQGHANEKEIRTHLKVSSTIFTVVSLPTIFAFGKTFCFGD
jgi:hypothetical protein